MIGQYSNMYIWLDGTANCTICIVSFIAVESQRQ